MIIGLTAQFFQAAPWLVVVFGGLVAAGVYTNNLRKARLEVSAINAIGTIPLGNILEPGTSSRVAGARVLLGNNAFDFEVVGETFYMQNFATLQRDFGLVDGQDWDEVALLVADPGNNFSKTAVAVFVSGLKLGHVPDDISPSVFRFLLQQGGSAKADAAIYFSAKNSMNSIWLDVAMPLSFRS